MPLQLTLLHRQCARHEMADRWTTTLLPLFKRQGVASLSWTAPSAVQSTMGQLVRRTSSQMLLPLFCDNLLPPNRIFMVSP
mmetsp:Transcript_132307/g.423275  ORF Transcript_132307/g.423275 Transcript_132307/m.423275 type:complete len:81 (-) Transcript_132307:312-554(-)